MSTPRYQKERVFSRGPVEQTGLLSKPILFGQRASSTFLNNAFDLHKSSGLKGLFRLLLSVLVTLTICVIKLLRKSAEESKGSILPHSAKFNPSCQGLQGGRSWSYPIHNQEAETSECTLVLGSSGQDPGGEWSHPQWLRLPTSGNQDSSLQASSEACLLDDFRFC